MSPNVAYSLIIGPSRKYLQARWFWGQKRETSTPYCQRSELQHSHKYQPQLSPALPSSSPTHHTPFTTWLLLSRKGHRGNPQEKGPPPIRTRGGHGEKTQPAQKGNAGKPRNKLGYLNQEIKASEKEAKVGNHSETAHTPVQYWWSNILNPQI